MRFIIVSRSEAEQGIVVRTPYVVVSITNPGRRRARIPKPAGFRGVLHVQFHDAVPVDGEVLPQDIVLMTREHAEKIWRFVAQHQDQVGTIVVHCEQGMSRSPAVAAALAERLGGNSDRFLQEYQPNEYVYALMLSTTPDGGPTAGA